MQISKFFFACLCGGLCMGLYAGDIFTVPQNDLPLEQTKYDMTMNVEINVYGNSLEVSEVEETMTDNVNPYTIRNMRTSIVRTRIIENDFVSVHVLQTSPSEIETFTENLFTGNAGEDINNSLSSLERNGSN